MLHVEACVSANARLWDAMKAMDRSCAGLALVTDDAGRLVGTLTDGDVRRALLGGAEVDDPLRPFIFRNYTAVGPHVARAEVLDMMQARRIDQVPVLDDEGRLVGLHLLQEMLGPVERPNWAVVMAGGVGTRLRPLTDSLPKPMLKVAGRPILERIVLHLVGHGIRRVFLSVGYKAQVIEDHFGDGSRFGCRIEYLREDRPMGTAGALSLLPERPTHPLLVMNGDLVTQADVGVMLDAHGGGITVGVRRYVHQVPFGTVAVEGSQIVGIEEKPRLERLINAGVYVLSPNVLLLMPAGAEFPMTQLIAESLAFGVSAFEVQDDWLDVGQHDQLRLARGAA
jgi:dTDP-glucose pyrophosphorylase